MKLKMFWIVLVGWALTVFCFGEAMLKPQFLFEFGHKGIGDGEFLGPKDVAVDLDEKIYVLDEHYYGAWLITNAHADPVLEEIFGEKRVQVFIVLYQSQFCRALCLSDWAIG